MGTQTVKGFASYDLQFTILKAMTDSPPATPATDFKSESSNLKSGLVSRLKVFAGDIKIHHTVFALPFALLSTFLAAGGMPKAGILVLILICMIMARTV